MGSCLICSEKVPDPDLVEHLRLMHPDQYEPSGEWPGWSVEDQSQIETQEPTHAD